MATDTGMQGRAIAPGSSPPGSPIEFKEWKLEPPWSRPGTVARTALVDRLLGSEAVPVISIAAPPGYGKTTLLSQWAEVTAYPVASVSLDAGDNDPAALMAYVAAALDRIEPIDLGALRSRIPHGTSVPAAVAGRVCSALTSMTGRVGLALDHAEELRNPQCRDAVAELAAHLPRGCQLVVASRGEPPLPLALLRSRGGLVELGVDELAMGEQEGRAVMEGAGVAVSETDVADLVRRTEGWPVGLYMAALALKAGGTHRPAGIDLTGDDRIVGDYLRSELLARLPQQTVTFLTRTSVLERMSGPLCDAVLRTSGSGLRLASLERSNLLVVPLDRQGQWYRYHRLFRDLLRAELGLRESGLVEQLHTRAAAWCEAQGMPEMAVDHAQAAGDADRTARLVATATVPTYAGGRLAICRQWFQWFEDHQLIEHYPQVAVLGAVLHALHGDPGAAEEWVAAAERAPSGGTLPDGSTMASWRAQLAAFVCRDGVGQMRRDAQIAWDGLAPDSPWRPSALLLEGISFLLDDAYEHADPILTRAFDAAAHRGAAPAASVALAERALVALERHDWTAADTLAEQALSWILDGHIEDYGFTTLVHAVVARTALHRGDVESARQHVAQCVRLRTSLSYAVPFLAVQTRLELASAYLELADSAGARVILREVRDVLRLRPDLGILPAKAEELSAKLAAMGAGTVGASSLTTAELRLLPLLSTHLSFREIGERLHVSRHTVKTQAMSVYRKLGVSSRSEAIVRGHEVGLLGE
jgi:LuxR family transcriptional regulator, maltose regulon positive regulatory protein